MEAAYEPAQIDTQAVVRFLGFSLSLGRARMGGMQSRAMKLAPFLAEIARGM